ncbi:MAG: response regulator [Planctomycetota bacterium]
MNKSEFRILVVDDEPDWVTTNRKALVRGGYTVDGAASPDEALARAKKTVYHMAFLDIDMPGMEGIALIDHLRATSSGLAVVMLTGYATPEKSAQARQKGITDFLEKIGPSGDRMLGEEMLALADEVFARAAAGKGRG